MDDKKISMERAEGQVEGLTFATEILQQLKESTKRLWIALFVVIGLWAATVGGFLLYLNQYDYVSSYEYSATGVNAIIDNEGNVIAQDIPDDKLLQVLEILNSGNSEGESNQGAD